MIIRGKTMAIATKTTRNRGVQGVCKRVCISILHRGCATVHFAFAQGCATDYIYVHMHTLHKMHTPGQAWVSDV